MSSDYILDESGAKIKAGANGIITLDGSDNGSIDLKATHNINIESKEIDLESKGIQLRATGPGNRNIEIQGHIASWDQGNDFITFESKIKAKDGLEVGSIGSLKSLDQGNDFITFENKIKAKDGLEVGSIGSLESTNNINIESEGIQLRATGPGNRNIEIQGHIASWDQDNDFITFESKIKAKDGLDSYHDLSIEGITASCKISLAKFKEKAENTQIQEGLRIELIRTPIIGKNIIKGRCNLIITGEKILIELIEMEPIPMQKTPNLFFAQTTYIDLVTALTKIQSDIVKLKEKTGIK